MRTAHVWRDWPSNTEQTICKSVFSTSAQKFVVQEQLGAALVVCDQSRRMPKPGDVRQVIAAQLFRVSALSGRCDEAEVLILTSASVAAAFSVSTGCISLLLNYGFPYY